MGPDLENIENLVSLSVSQYTLGSLILMVSYGAHFAFILYFIFSRKDLAPRYQLVPLLSALVMASAGLSLFREFNLWTETYSFIGGRYVPLTEGETFTNAYRYGNWTITVPLLLTQLPLAFALTRPEIRSRAIRMSIPALLMIWTGLVGQFGETGQWGQFNLWGIISTLFFVWLLIEVRGVIKAGVANAPAPIKGFPDKLWWYFLATWGLYPIAYSLPQLGFTGDVVVVRQLLFSIADISTKLVYGVLLSRFLIRRSALEGYLPAQQALGEAPATGTVAK